MNILTIKVFVAAAAKSLQSCPTLPGIKPGSTSLEADALTSEPPGKPENNVWHPVSARCMQ